MSDDRLSVVVAGFDRTVESVVDWDAVTPCDGWVARDVVRHLVGWVPGFLGHFAGVAIAVDADVDADPVNAWRQLAAAVTSLVGDAESASRIVDGPMGSMPISQLVDQFITTDIAVHTWDLARSNGLDDTIVGIDPDDILAGADDLDGALRSSGHYGPWVRQPDGASAQDRLLGFFGRDPAWVRPR